VESLCRIRRADLRALFGISLTTFFLVGCSHSEFELQHKHAVLENPSGVELEIRTRGGRKQFAVSETVEFEELYTAKYSGLWHIEILDGWNDASNASSDVVTIADGNIISNLPRTRWAGIICCDSRHVWLSRDPVRVPYKMFDSHTLTNPEHYINAEWHTLHLPGKPGQYQIYVTTHRVFGRAYSTTTYHGQGVPVSSNILRLEVK
jgi:hypothetical protein